MRLPGLPILLAGFLTASASAQSLMCPPPPAGRPCQGWHYHVQMYRPDTRAFFEFYGGRTFATEAACSRAREQQVASNRAVVEFMRANKDQKYEPDRIGGCHCDMTGEPSSVTFFGAPQRLVQLRTAEEVRLRVRERLLDRNAASDSEVVLSLWSDPPSTPALGGPKLVPPPAAPAAPLVTSADDLKPTRTIDTAKPAVAAMDLPLVDIGAPAAAAAVAATATPPPAPSPAPEPIVEERVEAEPETVAEPAVEAAAEAPEDTLAAAAERFISYESERIQNVLRASAAIADEELKTRIFEACMERIQLLSNLRLLIEGADAQSPLAAAAREVQSEAERLALVARLFGAGVQRHWAPKDAADVVLNIETAIASAPESVLRDTTAPEEQRKRALYVVLARTQPTEEQRAWLTGVVEGFLR